jgi:YgiT-type zinc finger domain-containing protein
MRILTCPSCERKALQAVTETVSFVVRGRKMAFPDVPHWRCNACGERLFDRESHRVMEAHRSRRRHSRGAA